MHPSTFWKRLIRHLVCIGVLLDSYGVLFLFFWKGLTFSFTFTWLLTKHSCPKVYIDLCHVQVFDLKPALCKQLKFDIRSINHYHKTRIEL